MSPGQPTEVVMSIAVVSFDGRVLEIFGRKEPDRIHVATITGVDYDGGDFTIQTRNQVDHPIVLNQDDEPMRGALEGLIDTVRRAAPNLKETA